jgi:hypothetical protein
MRAWSRDLFASRGLGVVVPPPLALLDVAADPGGEQVKGEDDGKVMVSTQIAAAGPGAAGPGTTDVGPNVEAADPGAANRCTCCGQNTLVGRRQDVAGGHCIDPECASNNMVFE